MKKHFKKGDLVKTNSLSTCEGRSSQDYCVGFVLGPAKGEAFDNREGFRIRLLKKCSYHAHVFSTMFTWFFTKEDLTIL